MTQQQHVARKRRAVWYGGYVHRSWLVCALSVGMVVGIGCSQLLPFFAYPLWYIVGIVAMVFAMAWPRRMMIAVAVLAGCIIGGTRGSIDIQQRSVWNGYIGTETTLSGVVADDADTDARGNRTIQIRDITIGGREMPGTMWLSITGDKRPQRSDRVIITTELSEGFGAFVASGYRATVEHAERQVPGDVALHARDQFARITREYITEPMASLGLGFLTGQRSDLPQDLEESLRIAGLTHIVVASGYNLTILVRLARRLFARRSRFQAVFVSCVLIVGFIAVTGLSPSMTRAGFVTTIALLFWYVGRTFHPAVLISLAAAVTGMITPSSVWGNLGWQLSFAAFLGVMIVAPIVQAYFFGDKKPGTLRQIIGETVSAQVLTAPILLASFGTVSVVAVIANIAVLPLVPLAMALTFVTGVLGLLFSAPAHIVGAISEVLLAYMTWVTETVATIPWAQLTVSISIYGVIALYASIAVTSWYMWRKSGVQLRTQNIIE